MKLLSQAVAGIHPSAQIHPTAIIGEDVQIGAYSKVHAYAVIGSKTTIGAHCVVHPFAHLGSPPQIRDELVDTGALSIGDHNRFFQGCTVSVGCPEFGGLTQIGNHNLLMAYTHVGHDSKLADGITLANHVSIAGHVNIENKSNVGGYAGIHQFVRLGQHCFVGANAMVSQDVPPFGLAAGDRARLVGFNRKGIARSELSLGEQNAIRHAFRKCFLRQDRTSQLDDLPWVDRFQQFIDGSERGVLKWHKERPSSNPG